MPSGYHPAVRAIFNRVDPLCLIGIGAPEDEHDNIVHELIKWRQPVAAGQVARALADGFGEPVDAADAQRLTDEINTRRERFLAQ